MKILITGGAVFIGGHTCYRALDRGHEVFVLDDLSSGRLSNVPPEVADVFEFSINDPEVEASIFRSVFPDCVIHLAAQPSLRKSIVNPAADSLINVTGSVNIMQLCRDYGSRFVMASTSAVYSSAGVLPFRESDLPDPDLPYGIAKYAAEIYTRRLLPRSGIILRYGNVYGPRQIPVGENQLVPHCVNRILRSDSFAINGSGEQTRDFVFATDIAEANVVAAEFDALGVFNIATGIATTVNHVCDLLAMAANWNIGFEHVDEKEGEMPHSVLDVTKAKDVLGWEARTSIAEGLSITYKYEAAQ